MEAARQPLGARVDDLTDVLPTAKAPKFRLEFTHDVRAKEMRWVLFTSAKRGAVGKLIFTLERNGESAHVKSITVNRECRGLGLARVLYLACLSTLAELKVPELCLEAEEDTKRHDKLVGMYRNWGFSEVAGAKVLFLYNQNDCFRKVPMSLSCHTRDFFPAPPRRETWFCMLTLTTSDGSCLVASANGAIEARAAQLQPKIKTPPKKDDAMWQTLLGANGEIFLRSVHGKFLCVEDSGTVLADRPWNSTWETFQVVPFRSAEEEDADDVSAAAQLAIGSVVEEAAAQSQQVRGAGGGVALKDFHGSYLCIDETTKKVVSSSKPVPWDGGNDIQSLVCNKSNLTPLHAKLLRKYQTRDFVEKQAAKYGTFTNATMSVADAYHALMVLTGDSEAPARSWLLHHVMATAEAAREDGHPDWFQLTLFLRGLGLLFLLWTDDDNAMLRSISAHEWMLLVSSWIIGPRIPDQIEYPELNALNADHVNAGKEAGAGMDNQQLGLENVTLPWTPDEYLFRVLQFNKATLPHEAFHAIRLWSLRLWYQQDCYEDLCAPQDAEMKEWLLNITAYASCKDKMKAVDPPTLMPYYFGLAKKYLPDELHCKSVAQTSSSAVSKEFTVEFDAMDFSSVSSAAFLDVREQRHNFMSASRVTHDHAPLKAQLVARRVCLLNLGLQLAAHSSHVLRLRPSGLEGASRATCFNSAGRFADLLRRSARSWSVRSARSAAAYVGASESVSTLVRGLELGPDIADERLQLEKLGRLGDWQ